MAMPLLHAEGGFLGVRVSGENVVVSSKDVARVFGKNHDKVLRDIRELGCSDDFRLSNFGESSYLNEQNREMPEYLMTRDGFTLLAMGYTGEKAMTFKEAYIEEFRRMEGELKYREIKQRWNIPETLPDALRLAADLAKGKEEAERKVKQLAPKASAWDATCEEGTEMSLQAIGKEFEKLGMGPRKIFDFLARQGIIYRLDGCWVPIQAHVERGRFRMKRVNILIHGEPKTVLKTLVTPKGRDFIAGLIGQKGGIVHAGQGGNQGMGGCP
jgi:anti-repressor protein